MFWLQSSNKDEIKYSLFLLNNHKSNKFLDSEDYKTLIKVLFKILKANITKDKTIEVKI
jgi:hypothetical protein